MKPVVVVGSGPAGSIAAKLLSDAGESIVWVERRKFPRPKTCGGGISGKSIRALGAAGIRPPREIEWCTEFEYRETEPTPRLLRAHAPTGTFGFVERGQFDAELSDAVTAPVKRVLGDGQPTEDGAGVQVRGERIPAEAIIAADGADSRFGPLAHGPIPIAEMGIACESIVPTVRGPFCALIAHPQTREGYSWVFARRDVANVGTGLFRTGDSDYPACQRRAGRVLSDAYGYSVDRFQNFWIVPVHRHGRPAVFANGSGVVVGDALGTADRLLAEGIYGALVSAAAAVRHWLEHRTFRGFERKWYASRYARDVEMIEELVMNPPAPLGEALALPGGFERALAVVRGDLTPTQFGRWGRMRSAVRTVLRV